MSEDCVEDAIFEFAFEDEQQLWEVVYEVAQRCFGGKREDARLPAQERIVGLVQTGLFAVSTWTYGGGTITFANVSDPSAALALVKDIRNWSYPPPNPVVCVYATDTGEVEARFRERRDQ
jgi:hypothetical protein